MDSRHQEKRKRKFLSSKLTKLSLKKSTQELKVAEDSFDNFGSFAFSLRSSKEDEGTVTSSGEETYLTNRNTSSVNIIDLLPSCNEVSDSSLSKTQLLENSLQRKTSLELSDRKHFKGYGGDSDESFAEYFETPCKAKRCSDKSLDQEGIGTEKVDVSDVSLVPKVENDGVICLQSSQNLCENNPFNNTAPTNKYFIETNKNHPVLSSLDNFAVDSVSTECRGGRMNGIIHNSLLGEQKEKDKYLLVNEPKQKQDSILSKSEVTISSAQDVNVPVLQQNTSRDVERVHDVDDDQLSPYFSASDLTCPLCWKKFDKKNIQTSHMKSCAVTHNVTTKQLLDALALQSKQAAERKALGLPETPVIAAKVPIRKNGPRKGTSVPKDQNLQLALALSVSMKEAEQLELEKEEEEALIEAGLEEEVMERQKSLLEKFGFTSSKLPSLDPANPRAGPKKVKSSVPVLVTRSREERERLITEKVAIILMGQEEETETSQVTEESSNSKYRQPTLNSKHLLKFLNKENYLWSKAQVPPEGIHRNSYYVSYLNDFITPSSVITGSLLKDIMKIPCREKTPVRDSKRKADTNQNSSYMQSDLKLVEHNPEGPPVSLENKVVVHPFFDGNEKKDVSSISSSLPSLQTAFLTFEKGGVLKNWKMQINNKTLSDVTIHVKDSLEIAAHKLVFFAQAPSILCDILEKADEKVGHLQWKHVSFDSAIAFLHYIYCGSVEEIYLLPVDLRDIQSLAVRYNITELSDHLNQLHKKDSSILTHLHYEHLMSTTGMKHNNNNERTNRMSDMTDIPQQQTLQHCKQIDASEDSAARSSLDIDFIEYSTDLKFPVNGSEDKSDRSSPDIFSEPHTPVKTNDNSRDNIDILSSMLCKTTSGQEPENTDYFLTREGKDANTVYNLTQRSPKEHLAIDSESTGVVEIADDSLSGMHEDANIPCNLIPGTPENYHSVNFADALTATPTITKRKLTDASLTPSKCDSPAKKVCKEWDTSPLKLESRNQNPVSSNTVDSLIETIDLTQNSDGAHENEAYQQNCAESIHVDGNNPSNREVVQLDDRVDNCSEELNRGNGAYCSDNYTAVIEKHETTSLPTSPLESCRTEESPEYGIPTFVSPNNLLKPINEITEAIGTNSPSSATPLALRCLSRLPDEATRRSISLILSQLVDNDTQSLISAHDEVECKKISPSVTSTHSSDTPKTLKHTAMDSLKMMLEDSFVDQIRDNSFFRQEFINSPPGSYRTVTNGNVNDENSVTPEYHLVTPGNKQGVSEELTPLPDYSTMKTPQLKKELHKYGLKPMKRKQAKLILRHIYNELHPLVPVNSTVTTEAVPPPPPSVMGDREGREKIAKQIKHSAPLEPIMRSPRKRNLLKCITDSSKGNSSHHKDQSDNECENEMLFESNHNAKDYSILVDDEEVFHEQSGTSENKSDCSMKVDLQTAIQTFIINNPEIHEKILMYEPVWLNDLKDGLKANKIKFKLNDLMDCLDEQCITYRTSVGPHKSRQRRKGTSASQPHNTAKKKMTTVDYDLLPSSAC